MQEIECAFSRALFNAGRSIAARIAMIATTMRSSIRVKILVFSLQSKNIEQGTRKEEGRKTLEQFNNGMRLLFLHVKSCFDIRGVKASFPKDKLIFILIPLLGVFSFFIFHSDRDIKINVPFFLFNHPHVKLTDS